MLARTHAYSGMAAAAVAASLGLPPVDHPVHVIGWLAATTGAALLPDLDHPNSAAARTWGLLGRATARAVHAVAGGHRGGTHDVLTAPLTAGIVGWLCSLHLIPALGLLTLVFGLALWPLSGLLRFHPRPAATGALAAAAAVPVIADDHLMWLPYAVALGVLLHILGDAVTNHSVPIPFTWLRTAGPRRFGTSPLRTGSTIERWLVAPSCLVAAAVALLLPLR